MYLGLDLGTSGLKALVIDDEQRQVAATTQPLTTSRPRFGWSEQDPGAWIEAAEKALDALNAQRPGVLKAVRGVGLSGQMHGATLLGDDDRVLRPCILWNDTRSADQAKRLDARPEFRLTTGNIVFPGFTASMLAWVKDNEPSVFAQIAKVLLPKDYLRLWLTGEHVTDYADASGTSWLDTGGGDWSDPLLEATGVSRAMMPRLCESAVASGAVRARLTERWGLSAIVAGGAGDSAASAIGVGAVTDGDAFISIGTSGVFLVSTDAFRPAPDTAVHTFRHAAPERWHQIGVILSAASALTWFGALTSSTPQALVDRLGATLRRPGPAMFLPYLSGERTPHNDAQVRGVFSGLAHETDAPALTHAVLEGVAFAFKDNLEAVRATGSDPQRVLAVGGGAASDYWLRLISTILELPIDVPSQHDVGAAFGAARLGMAATTPIAEEIVFARPAIERSIMPDANLIDSYRAAFLFFQELYRKIN